jgi:hypothetical protein
MHEYIIYDHFQRTSLTLVLKVSTLCTNIFIKKYVPTWNPTLGKRDVGFVLNFNIPLRI